MSKNITGMEPDPRKVYGDIIDLPHHQSDTHPHMSLYDRAAQFSAYKALTGYEDMVSEEARLTEDELDLGESELEMMDRKLGLITDALAHGSRPVLTFTVFVPDTQKAGGSYTEMTAAVRKIDSTERLILLMNRKAIPFDRIISIRGPLVDGLDYL